MKIFQPFVFFKLSYWQKPSVYVGKVWIFKILHQLLNYEKLQKLQKLQFTWRRPQSISIISKVFDASKRSNYVINIHDIELTLFVWKLRQIGGMSWTENIIIEMSRFKYYTTFFFISGKMRLSNEGKCEIFFFFLLRWDNFINHKLFVSGK